MRRLDGWSGQRESERERSGAGWIRRVAARIHEVVCIRKCKLYCKRFHVWLRGKQRSVALSRVDAGCYNIISCRYNDVMNMYLLTSYYIVQI